MNRLAALAGSLMLVAAWSAAAAADETVLPVRPSMLLGISSPLAETRDAAFDRAMKEPGGAMTITVRNPWPPGTHGELPPLPGRVRK